VKYDFVIVGGSIDVKNLYLTGQNINMPLIIGVALSAILKAGEFVGINFLTDIINDEYQQE
jgi:hypothetical protein